jgi:hypothetical protein
MDVTRLTGIGRDLHGRLRRFFDAPPGRAATPLEIGQAVLDDVETRVEPLGRGRRVFPYARVQVRVLSAEESHAPLEAAFAEFGARVGERLAELRCDVARVPAVELTCLAEAPASWSADQVYDVIYVRDAPADTGRPAAATPGAMTPPVLRVTVLKGVAVEPAFTFHEATVSIGRTADPTDDLGRVRRNRIAFADVVDGVTETVGRAHARLRFDAETGDYRLYDEGSSNGTAIVRDGDVVVVPRRDPRGVRVRSGDEIQVGRAVLRLEIDD